MWVNTNRCCHWQLILWSHHGTPRQFLRIKYSQGYQEVQELSPQSLPTKHLAPSPRTSPAPQGRTRIGQQLRCRTCQCACAASYSQCTEMERLVWLANDGRAVYPYYWTVWSPSRLYPCPPSLRWWCPFQRRRSSFIQRAAVTAVTAMMSLPLCLIGRGFCYSSGDWAAWAVN